MFIAQGYRRAQMDDVAEALGVAKGTLYRYVESKEALFDAALRFGDGHQSPPSLDQLPLPTPAPGQSAAFLRQRLAAEATDLALVAAVSGPPAADTTAELETIVRDLYRRLDRNRVTIKLVDRCAQDYPGLAAAWFDGGRWAQHTVLVTYLEQRIAQGRLRAVPDVAIAARLVLETIVFWAVHRHWDPAPQSLDEDRVEDSVVDLITSMLAKKDKRP